MNATRDDLWMTKTMAAVVVMAACGGTDSAETETRIEALEAEVAKLTTMVPKAGPLEGEQLREGNVWWCPSNTRESMEMKCAYGVGGMMLCRYSAGGNSGGCIPTRHVACRGLESGEPTDCYLSWAACTGGFLADGNTFVTGQRGCIAVQGKEQIR